MVDLKDLTIKKAHKALIKKEYKVIDLVESYKKVIAEKDPTYHACLEVFSDIDDQVENAQRMIDNSNTSELAGIPFILKDNILVKGHVASAGSKMLENFVSPYDATAVRKLKDAGAIIIGRANMDEFAMGVSTENSAFGTTRNPFDKSRVAGGSSGGSAAAVALDETLVALGSDTGGSVRQPSSFCGVVGFKPTYGSVSRFGLIAMASSFDVIGPITRTVEDAEIVFNVIRGTDALDSTSFYPKEPNKVSEKIRVGVPREFLSMGGIDERVLKNFDESVERLRDLGFEIVDIDLPNIKYALSAYYIIVPAEVSSNLARFDGVKYGAHLEGKDVIDDYFVTRGGNFGREVRRRIILGTYVLSSGYYDAFYHKANAVRDRIKSDYNKAFENVDVIITPTTPAPAFKIGEKVNDPLQMYLEDVFTCPVNVSGNPAISVPCGFAEVEGEKLPLGLQFIGRPYEEATLFKTGKRFLNESDGSI
ncbi:MAG: glutaminyl-tRNA synthase (glutamine-hydrolyzing) subunit A [Candidatus Zambryskibacteria bacterium RIFCSPHIGHO2_01_FULL_43_27]|uniref:Glutamyl-tRNA(Gln) amidotransferase subunit A n=1 Tax=Candidatus Zambryskibacteria bacterium RIFCSPLOWO2_01_FULL_43_17 TaxID=1802760 RepID=A0A1G2U130_9BACT|nr:MAG: glutaminyl-tRNA synthase (glutamine-hydrolyzing) subunit A [Candidatus Zambryskibacteria bacterium RIFCSPHIGHO2_01_FULL_43_27]OHA99802.1 MAG: glutaminyl-tRNA synthase (glutamine-hydrolyzing) subunit A [Candidatus Zambryskibacteria bacterium RIFCSPHIGHO2_12_FULL_43_12b]OHB03193.1 MAG: glutaminyl-tRNA synthase (glutamine-hydrolyzing) subunit A [Candidatus Zambryskibacteria bacterium RIFCSPLOWO2_01_FULL_43_17]